MVTYPSPYIYTCPLLCNLYHLIGLRYWCAVIYMSYFASCDTDTIHNPNLKHKGNTKPAQWCKQSYFCCFNRYYSVYHYYPVYHCCVITFIAEESELPAVIREWPCRPEPSAGSDHWRSAGGHWQQSLRWGREAAQLCLCSASKLLETIYRTLMLCGTAWFSLWLIFK